MIRSVGIPSPAGYQIVVAKVCIEVLIKEEDHITNDVFIALFFSNMEPLLQNGSRIFQSRTA